MHDAPHLDGLQQLQTLYLIYGLGWRACGACMPLSMATRSQSRRTAAQCGRDGTDARRLRRNLIYVFVCLPVDRAGAAADIDWLPGFIYFLLGPLQTMNGVRSARQVKALAAANA